MVNIAVLGTCDTKLQELLILREYILESSDGQASVTLIDAGRQHTAHDAITITQSDLLSYAPADAAHVDPSTLPRGEVVKHMTQCATACVRDLFEASKIHALVAAGGSSGTALAAGVMRAAVPIGFPKLIVSTVASGDTGPYVGEVDIALMYSVVDIAGSNALLRAIFANAAGAIAGMARAYANRKQTAAAAEPDRRSRVGVTMFGVTTPCVDAARAILENEHGAEVYVFHATGHGGQAMERLVRAGELDGVLDITTTEVADHLVGGVMSAGPERLEAAARAGLPTVVSVGATDMVNFGPRATVPQQFDDGKRLLYEHNPSVTLMRTSVDECGAIGAFIADKLRAHAKDPGRVKVLLPTGGVSIIATPGAPFADAAADDALFAAVEQGLKGSGVEVVRSERDINDEAWATEAAHTLARLMHLEAKS